MYVSIVCVWTNGKGNFSFHVQPFELILSEMFVSINLLEIFSLKPSNKWFLNGKKDPIYNPSNSSLSCLFLPFLPSFDDTDSISRIEMEHFLPIELGLLDSKGWKVTTLEGIQRSTCFYSQFFSSFRTRLEWKKYTSRLKVRYSNTKISHTLYRY